MSTTLVGIIISAFVSIVGFWIKWRLSQATKDRQRREISEQSNKDIKETLKSIQEANADHEKAIIQIYDNLGDSNFATKLLSSQIDNTKTPSPSTP
jgi:hypothetical protein